MNYLATIEIFVLIGIGYRVFADFNTIRDGGIIRHFSRTCLEIALCYLIGMFIGSFFHMGIFLSGFYALASYLKYKVLLFDYALNLARGLTWDYFPVKPLAYWDQKYLALAVKWKVNPIFVAAIAKIIAFALFLTTQICLAESNAF